MGCPILAGMSPEKVSLQLPVAWHGAERHVLNPQFRFTLQVVGRGYRTGTCTDEDIGWLGVINDLCVKVTLSTRGAPPLHPKFTLPQFDQGTSFPAISSRISL